MPAALLLRLVGASGDPELFVQASDNAYPELILKSVQNAYKIIGFLKMMIRMNPYEFIRF